MKIVSSPSIDNPGQACSLEARQLPQPRAPRSVLARASAVTALTFLMMAGSAASTQAAPTVLLSGLNNPRGLTIGPDGALYVTEAGAPFTPTASSEFITVRGTNLYYGTNGDITRLQGGVATQIVTGLPMLENFGTGEITGAQGITFSTTGDLYFSIGLGADPAQRTSANLMKLGQLMRLPAGGGALQTVADLSAYEGTFNPAGGPKDSNPYQIAFTPSGILVADAGGNDLLKVTTAGLISLVTTFGPVLPTGADAVPTGVAIAKDGTAYVTQLTGVPFPVGGASVFRLDGSLISTVGTGFTNVVDMKVGPDGMLYLLEIAHNSLISGSPIGGLWELNPFTGEKTLLMTDGLIMPTALAIGGDGTIYIANGGVIPGGGSIIAIAPVPEPAAYGVVAAALLGGLIVVRHSRKNRVLKAAS